MRRAGRGHEAGEVLQNRAVIDIVIDIVINNVIVMASKIVFLFVFKLDEVGPVVNGAYLV